MPIDYEAFGDLGGVGTMQDGREAVPGGKQAGDFGVHVGLFVGFEANAGGAAEQVHELVRECDMELTGREAGLKGDEAGGEVHFSEAHIRDATADRDVRHVTEQRVEQVEERRNVVHAALIGRSSDTRYASRQT